MTKTNQYGTKVYRTENWTLAISGQTAVFTLLRRFDGLEWYNIGHPRGEIIDRIRAARILRQAR